MNARTEGSRPRRVGNTICNTPTGTVQFIVDGGQPVSATLNGSGMATFSTSFSTTGNHTVTANYLGTQNGFSPSSATVTESILNASSTALAASARLIYASREQRLI